MKTLVIILTISFVVTLCWGMSYRKWYRKHKYTAIKAQARLVRINAICHCLSPNYVYSVREHDGGYYVQMFNMLTGDIPIKRFYDKDKEYARRCAEELCEKLNEKT